MTPHLPPQPSCDAGDDTAAACDESHHCCWLEVPLREQLVQRSVLSLLLLLEAQLYALDTPATEHVQPAASSDGRKLGEFTATLLPQVLTGVTD